MSSMHSLISLLAQAAAPIAPAEPWYRETWFGLLIALVVIILPFVVGNWLAKRLRLTEYSMRVCLILFSLSAGIVICITGWPPKRGIDLSGGVILVYEVDQSKASAVDVTSVIDQLRKELNSTTGLDLIIAPAAEGNSIEITLPGTGAEQTATVENALSKFKLPDTSLVVEARPVREGHQVLLVGLQRTDTIDMDRMISAIGKRVNPGGQKEVTIRRMGSDRVEVIIPQAEPAEVDLVKAKISTAGALQFHILANPKAPNDQAIIELAKQTKAHDVKQKDPDGKEETVAQWVELDPKEFTPEYLRNTNMVLRPGKDGKTEALVLVTANDTGGSELSGARKGSSPRDGSPAVDFSFNARGSASFGELTGTHVPDPSNKLEYQLGIVLDNVLMSSATVQSQITSNGQITGRFTDEKVEFLVDILNAGSLPAALAKIPVAEYSASAQLGNDTIRAGAYSMIVGTVAILIFMQFYYRFAGFVANLAVLMNLVLVLALMILIKASLTLAGLAGLVLSVGMAVDANVLIYERMREEQERGAGLRMAIRNGFGRAMSTIIDSHCTTLITGIVLFIIGTDQLRGFATTLVLGLLLNLYTAVYCSRVVFELAERRRWISRFNMRHIFGKTTFDFVKWMPMWMTLSVIAIVIGMSGAVIREMHWFNSAGMFGIDFTGGTAVQAVFDKPTDIALVREKVKELPDVSVSGVASTEGEQPSTRFNIDTSYPMEKTAGGKEESKVASNTEAIKAVKEMLGKIFAGQLRMYSMDIVSIEPAPADDTATPNPVKPADEKATTEKSAESKTAGEKSAQEKKDSVATDAQAKKSQATAAASDSQSTTGTSATGTGVVATLKFPDALNYSSLGAMLKDAQKADALPETVFDISSPDKDYTPGSSLAVQDWTVRTTLTKQQTDTLLKTVQQQLAETPVFPTANNIGGKVASDTESTAYYALFVSNVLVALYIWIRFQNLIFGMAAIVALIHDVFIAVGALALSYWLAGPLGFLQIDPFKISLEVVAALLTIVGYSINDTIVVFDRIREIRGKSPDLSASMINQAINQTLSRTILTSTTVFLVTAILFFFGGEGVHAFAFAMMIGVLTGTYSSVFIAAPVLLWFRRPSVSATGIRKTSSGAPLRATGTA